MSSRREPRAAFTLIELLVVIAIIAILAVVVILTLNPAQLLAESRDSQRLSDMATLSSALNLYVTDQTGASSFSLSNASNTGISIYDPNSSTTCGSLDLPSLNTGQSWQCSTSTSSRNVNGAGWIPVNFSKISSGAPIGSLPVDPVNQTSTGLFYTYNTNGAQFEVTADLESSKYKAQYGQAPDTNLFPEVISGGTPTVSALYSPSGLEGYWTLNEGTGTTALDTSGNGYNGVWNGSTTSGSYYTSGKIGTWAGEFNGVNDYVSTASSIPFGSSGAIVAWIDPASGSIPPPDYPSVAGYYNTGNEPMINLQEGTGAPYIQYDAGTYNLPSSKALTSATWYQVAGTWVESGSSTTLAIYVNGVQTGIVTLGTTFTTGSAPFVINKWSETPGGIDDVRLYNRVLSPAEIAALYDAEK